MQDLLAFTALNGLLLALALRLSSRLLSGAEPARRFTGTVLLLPVVMVLAIQLVALVTPFTTLKLIGLLALALVAELAAPRPDALSAPAAAERALRPAEIGVLAVLAGIGAHWARAGVWQPIRYVWDDLTYHAALPAWWLETGTLSPPAFTYQAYFPLNTELVATWLMLPLRSDAHVNLAFPLWIALGCGALLMIGRNTRSPFVLRAAVAACLLASPKVVIHLGSFSAVDLAVSSCTLAALAFASTSPADPRRRRLDALFCGLAGGFAVGAKIPALVPFGLLAFWWLLECRRDSTSDGRARWTPLAVFAAAGLATGGYWYVQNWLLTGNPLFPAEIGPFSGPLDRETQRITSLLGVLDRADWSPELLRVALRKRMSWPLPLGWIAFGSLVAAPWMVYRQRSRNQPARLYYVLLLVCCGLTALVLYPTQPFSGMANRPGGGMHHNIRYLLPVFMIGLSLAPCVVPKRPYWVAGGVAVALAAAAHALAGWAMPMLPWMALAGGVAAAVGFAWQRIPQTAQRRAAHVVIALALLSLGAVVWLRTPAKTAGAADNLYAYAGYGGRFSGGWRALDGLPDGARVSFVSNIPFSLSYYYPQFGRRIQLTPVPIDFDGRIRAALHEVPSQAWRTWWWEFDRSGNAIDPAFVRNLRVAGVEYILVNRWSLGTGRAPSPPWPAQRALLLESPEALKIYADSESEIYDLRSRVR